MKIFYHEQFNIDLGIGNHLHPFDGRKFRAVHQLLSNHDGIVFRAPEAPISQPQIDAFLNELMNLCVRRKVHILRALEVPNIPLIPYSYIDRKILLPMRWGAGATLDAARLALAGETCWNLAGGYHHASPHSMEGFCIYNDIGIAHQELLKSGELRADDRILIIDTDAHHGNGNAHTFSKNAAVVLLDVYNADIYPRNAWTRNRIDLPVPLHTGVAADEYLQGFQRALARLDGEFRMAFVVAGTDVLAVDKLGGMRLETADVVTREQLTLARLNALGIPAVFLGGGGYSKHSAPTIAAAIAGLTRAKMRAA